MQPLLAFCNVRTLYLHNVPDDAVERLERLAARDGMSLNALAVRELVDVSRRADNPQLLDSLPNLRVDAEDVVRHVAAARAER